MLITWRIYLLIIERGDVTHGVRSERSLTAKVFPMNVELCPVISAH